MGINWRRRVFHFISALCLLFFSKSLPEKLFSPFLALLTGLSLIWELLRLKFPNKFLLQNIWLPLLKEKEKKHLSDAFFFLLGLFLASLFVSGKKLEFLVLVLGISDPLAGTLGELYGKPFLKFKKSLLGALLFFSSSLLIAIFYLKISLLNLIILSLFLTFIEFFTERDNFWIPFVGAICLRLL